MDPFLTAVILAAGSSTRMGKPKLILPIDGRPLLNHVVDEAVRSCADEVIVVLGDHAEQVRAGLRLPDGGRIRVVVNADHAGGQSASLRVGLHCASPRAVAAGVLLGDQPGVSAEFFDRIAAASMASERPIGRPIFRTADGARVPGHPVFLARRVWDAVDRLEGDRGARALIALHPDWLLEIPIGGEPPADIDTPEDYRQAVDSATGGPVRH